MRLVPLGRRGGALLRRLRGRHAVRDASAPSAARGADGGRSLAIDRYTAPRGGAIRTAVGFGRYRTQSV
jgi:hypothetical protein